MPGKLLRTVRRIVVDRVSSRLPRSGDDDRGTILLETIVAISLITVIMSAVGAEYVSGLAATNDARLESVSVQIASSNVDQIRALHASDLITGRGSSAVDAERQIVSNFTSVAGSTFEAYDSTSPSASVGNTFSTAPSTTTIGTTSYTVYRYFECTSVSNAGSCLTTPSQATLTSNNIRAIVVVTWPQRGCATVATPTTAGPTCSYTTSSVVSADDDLTFDLNQPLPPAPTVSNPTGLTVAVNDPVSYAMTVNNNGVAPFTWAVTSGALPTGLTMTTDGSITGTVGGAAGTATSTITVTDAYLRTSSDTITWTIESPLAIAPLANQASARGAAVSKILSASGGAGSGYVFSDPNSTLPAGLTISSGGSISGTITAATATYVVTIKAADPQACPACVSTPRVATMSFNWTVSNQPLGESTPSAQKWTANTALSATYTTTVQMTATGGDSRYAWTASGLPAGVTINSSSGLISGTPTSPNTGTASITVSDPTSTAVSPTTVTFAWTVYAAPTVSTLANQTNSIGGSVNVPVTSSCPNATCRYTAIGLPTGLAISATTGTISGTAGGTARTYTGIAVTITDSAGAATSGGSSSWTVTAAPTVGALGTQAFTETGVESVSITFTCPVGPCTLTLANSIPGLGLTTSPTASGDLSASTSITVTSASGIIYVGGTVANSAVTGSATSMGYTPAVNITTSDSASASSGSATWTAYATPTVTSPGDLTSSQNAAVAVTVAPTCPDAPCTFQLAGAPAALSINSSGLISGTITSSAQTFTSVRVTATDFNAVTATTTFSWTILATTNNLSTFFNNVGVTQDNNTNAGNFDGANGSSGSGDSFSATALANATVNPLVAGARVSVAGLSFTWPATAGTGQPDNVIASGQTITVAGTGSTLGFLLSGDYGSPSGNGTVTYTDGTTASYTISTPDWWGTSGNVAATAARLNTPNNGQNTGQQVSVYYATVALTTGKTVRSVTLPNVSSNVGNGVTAMHIFAMSLSAATLANTYNTIGVTVPGSNVSGGMDSSGNTYSRTALANANASPGSTVNYGGFSFTWPTTAGTTSSDNVLAFGQTIAPTSPPAGTALGFLLASNGATTTGNVTITYTDGTQQAYPISASAWNSGSAANAALTTSAYDVRFIGNTSTLGTRYVYFASVALASGKTISTVQLPTVSSAVSSNSMHIFAMAVK